MRKKPTVLHYVRFFVFVSFPFRLVLSEFSTFTSVHWVKGYITEPFFIALALSETFLQRNEMSDAASRVDKHLESLVNVIFMFCFFRYTLFALAICHRRLAAYQFSNVYPFVRVPGSDI